MTSVNSPTSPISPCNFPISSPTSCTAPWMPSIWLIAWSADSDPSSAISLALELVSLTSLAVEAISSMVALISETSPATSSIESVCSLTELLTLFTLCVALSAASATCSIGAWRSDSTCCINSSCSAIASLTCSLYELIYVSMATCWSRLMSFCTANVWVMSVSTASSNLGELNWDLISSPNRSIMPV